MKRWILVAVSALVATLLPQQAWGIVYGVPDDSEHPNVGAFVAVATNPDTNAKELFQVCTGTLIESDIVVSASHCFSGIPDWVEQEFFTLDPVVDADKDGLVDPGVTRLDGTPIVHPLYGSGAANNSYDVALFKLDDPVIGVAPAALPSAGMLDQHALTGETFTAVGYGAVRETNRKSWQSISTGWRREKADQQLVTVTKAWATFSQNLATGNGGTCYGDSGGPHFIGDVVASVDVTGDTPCKATGKTYRLDTPFARAFLGQYLSLP